MHKDDNQIKFALDVNTKHTGWSLWVNNELKGWGTVHTPADTTKGMGMPMHEDHYCIVKGLTPIFMQLRKALDEENAKNKKQKQTYLMIGIENSKVRVGADSQQKLDLYTGMYLGFMSNTARVILPEVKIAMKLITANWQTKIFKHQKDMDSKESSRKFASALLPGDSEPLTVNNDPGGDMADAINIGYILEDLEDHGTTKWVKGQKSKNIQRIKKKLQNSKEKLAEYKLRSAERVKKGLSPTDAQLALRIKTKEDEITQFEKELLEWQR